MKKTVLLAVLVIWGLSGFSQKWNHSYAFPPGVWIQTLAVMDYQVLAATSDGIYRTGDTGKTWTKVSTFVARDISCASMDVCYACGDKGRVFKTTDGGQNWSATSANAHSTKDLYQIKAVTEDDVLVSAIKSRSTSGSSSDSLFVPDSLFMTTNGGSSWSATLVPTSSQNSADLRRRHIINDKLVFTPVGSGGNGIHRTTNLGQSLAQVTTDVSTAGYWQMIDMISDKEGFLLKFDDVGLGQPEMWIANTQDSGKSFQHVFYHTSSQVGVRPSSMDFVNTNTGWITGLFGPGETIWKTTNGGSNWVPDTFGTTNIGLSAHNLKLRMVTPTYGWGFERGSRKIVKYGEYTGDTVLVKGKVYYDKNSNCAYDAGIDEPLANKVVRIKENDFMASTDANGNYEITGLQKTTYTVEGIYIKSRFIKLTCGTQNGVGIAFSGSNTTASVDYPVEVDNRAWPVISVSGRKRRCFRNNTVVSYKNEGIGVAQNVKIQVKLPQYVIFISADKSYTTLADGTLEFNIGTLAGLQSGTINITDSVMCGDETIRGRTVCTEAYIFSDSVDYGGDTANWDNSEIIVKARCMNGWINFQVINTSDSAMTDSAGLRFLSDAVLKDTKKYKLGAKDTLNLTFHADYTTWRLEADQRPGHPLSQYAQATIEGCEGEGAGTVSTGFVNKLPVNDFRYKKYVHCEQIRDSYDPNDKAVFPTGLTASNYVKPGTPLTYRVRFQNTGSAPAVKVVVKDTLSGDLDLSTFAFGGATHSYTYKITGQGKAVLEVTFNNINLPDSTTDKVGSNGFFTYTVEHKGGIPEGTQIDNNAYIYFDFNSPIKTNTASVTIKDTVPTVIEPVDPETDLPFIIKGYAKDTVCKGDTIKLIIVGQGPYNWTKLGSGVSVGTGFELEMIMDTTTTFTGYTADGFANFMVLVKECSTGPNAVKEIYGAGIDIYPNPSSDGIFTITNTDGIRSIQVIDITGREAGAVTGNTIRLSDAATGVYFVIVTTDSGNTYYKKLVKN